MAAHHGIKHRAFIKLEVVLTQYRESFAGAESDGALRGREFSGKDLHQRGFSGTIGSDHAIAVAMVESKVHILKENSLSELHS